VVELLLAGVFDTVGFELEAPRVTEVGETFEAAEWRAAAFEAEPLEGALLRWLYAVAFAPELTEIVLAA
jgi:hypothetical protein